MVSKNSDKRTLHFYSLSFFVNGSVIVEVGGSQKEMQEVSDLDRVKGPITTKISVSRMQSSNDGVQMNEGSLKALTNRL